MLLFEYKDLLADVLEIQSLEIIHNIMHAPSISCYREAEGGKLESTLSCSACRRDPVWLEEVANFLFVHVITVVDLVGFHGTPLWPAFYIGIIAHGTPLWSACYS